MQCWAGVRLLCIHPYYERTVTQPKKHLQVGRLTEQLDLRNAAQDVLVCYVLGCYQVATLFVP